MLHLLVGHRGVGKSSFLLRVRAAYAAQRLPVATYDLDAELAQQSGLPIAAWFAQHGEARFRQQEHSTLRRLLQRLSQIGDEADIYIALGAGYDEDPRHAVPASLLQQTRVLWLRRESDAHGRIFPSSHSQPDRPRLAPELSPLAEYRQRYAERQRRYTAWHDNVWLMPEGSDTHPAMAEPGFILSALASPAIAPDCDFAGVLTILPQQLTRPTIFADWLARRLRFAGLRFELRDDLLSDAELALVDSQLPAGRVLRSFRRQLPPAEALASSCRQNNILDIPLELLVGLDAERWLSQQPSHILPGLIASLHERAPHESLPAAAQRLLQAGARLGATMLKLAVEVTSFSELAAGIKWAAAAPQQRVFLPRTPATQLQHGPERWRWFRTLQAKAPDPKLAFLREGDGSSPDQPTLCEHWHSRLLRAAAPADRLGGTVPGPPHLAKPNEPPPLGVVNTSNHHFAAVLGDPVQHSRSPSQHRAFFAAAGLPFVAVPCHTDDFSVAALPVLQQLGLRFAAVTAPLKRLAGATVGLPACNTLVSDGDGCWRGTNTDPHGLRALLSTLRSDDTVAIWGGGGVLPSLHAVVPQARAFSLRSGRERRSDDRVADSPVSDADDSFRPSALIWAAGHTEGSAGHAPPATWRPRVVYDLDYREDSTGREYAMRVAAEYVCGLAMFTAQAAAQQQFWRPFLARSPD